MLSRCYQGYVVLGEDTGYETYPHEGGEEKGKYYEEQKREARKHYEEAQEVAHKERDKKHKRHEYRYYPSVSVYYDVNRKIYFYLEGDKWRVSGALPSGIRVGYEDDDTIEMYGDSTYTKHAEHKRE